MYGVWDREFCGILSAMGFHSGGRYVWTQIHMTRGLFTERAGSNVGLDRDKMCGGSTRMRLWDNPAPKSAT